MRSYAITLLQVFNLFQFTLAITSTMFADTSDQLLAHA